VCACVHVRARSSSSSGSRHGQSLSWNDGAAAFQACLARTTRVRARVRVCGQIIRVRCVVVRVAGARMDCVEVGGNEER
jgi:hypothetical protein